MRKRQRPKGAKRDPALKPADATSADSKVLHLSAGIVRQADTDIRVLKLKQSEAILRIYDAIHTLARWIWLCDRDPTVEPTDLTHEAFMKLLRDRRAWLGEKPFIAPARIALRRLLYDHARERCAKKRGGGLKRVGLDSALTVIVKAAPEEIVELGEALEALAKDCPQVERVALLHVYGEMEIADVAAELGTQFEEAAQDWRFAKAYLGQWISHRRGRRRFPARKLRRAGRRISELGLRSGGFQDADVPIAGRPRVVRLGGRAPP